MEEDSRRTAAADVAELFRSGLRLAKRLLDDQPSFVPFGYVMAQSGKTSMLSGAAGDDGPTDSTKILAVLEGTIRHAAKRGAKAGMVVADAHEVFEDGKRRDVILLTAEHANGEPTQMFVPYTRRFGRVKLGEPRTRRIEARLFV